MKYPVRKPRHDPTLHTDIDAYVTNVVGMKIALRMRQSRTYGIEPSITVMRMAQTITMVTRIFKWVPRPLRQRITRWLNSR